MPRGRGGPGRAEQGRSDRWELAATGDPGRAREGMEIQGRLRNPGLAGLAASAPVAVRARSLGEMGTFHGCPACTPDGGRRVDMLPLAGGTARPARRGPLPLEA